mgnify:CR=1 FL=1
MLRIYNEIFNNINIINYSIYNNMLYIVVYDNSFRLLCFDLIRRYLVYNKYLTNDYHIYIYNNNLYYFKDYLCYYKSINNNDLIKSDEKYKYIINIKNEPHYIVIKNNLYLLIDDKGNVKLTMKPTIQDINVNYKDGILYINRIKQLYCLSYEDNIIFYYLDGKNFIKEFNDIKTYYIIFNLNTKEIKVNKSLKINQVISPNKVIHDVNDILYIYDIFTEKSISVRRIISDKEINNFNSPSLSKFIYDNNIKIEYFEHNNIQYYICLAHYSDETILTILSKNIKNDIIEHVIKYANNIDIIKNSNNNIKIGTKDNNVDMSLDFLINNSEHIKDIHEMYNDENFDLISDGYKYIDIYKRYKETFNFMNDELEKLFYICNYLLDNDLDNVCENIIKVVESKENNIDDDFKFLELFITSTINNVYIKNIFVIILKKYKKEEIMGKLKSVSSTLYKFICEEMINITLDNFEFKTS